MKTLAKRKHTQCQLRRCPRKKRVTKVLNRIKSERQLGSEDVAVVQELILLRSQFYCSENCTI